MKRGRERVGQRDKYFLNVRTFQISESEYAVNKKASTPHRSGWRCMPRRHQKAETWFRELKNGTNSVLAVPACRLWVVDRRAGGTVEGLAVVEGRRGG